MQEKKSEPNQVNQALDINENKNILEREMNSNMSDSNINKKVNEKTLTPDKDHQQKFQNKNYIIKKNKNNNYFNNLNNSAKFVPNGIKQKFKTFLIKKNNHKVKMNHNHSSQKNILSINILNRIQEVKKNKTKNNFYKTSKIKNSSEINSNTNNINITKSTQIKNNKINLIKTPVTKTKKMEIFKKNNTNRKFNTFKGINKKEDIRNNYKSSFSIKVNKTYFNKDKKDKSKNLKKTLTKNMNNATNTIKKDNKK